MSLGSSTEVDVPLSSELGKGRRNARLELKSGGVILKDSITKYGTYMKVEEPVMIGDNVLKHFLFWNKIISLKVE